MASSREREKQRRKDRQLRKGIETFGAPAHPTRSESLAEKIRGMIAVNGNEWEKADVDGILLDYCPDALDAAQLRIDLEHLRRRVHSVTRDVLSDAYMDAHEGCHDRMAEIFGRIMARYKAETEAMSYAEALMEGM